MENELRSDKQAWLLAVCGSTDEFPMDWVAERPDLLGSWPVGQEKTPGIKRGDHFLYYVPGEHQRLIAAGRAAGPADDEVVRVQMYLVIPRVNWGPRWKVSEKSSGKIGGKRAALLDDPEYRDGLLAFGQVVWKRFEPTLDPSFETLKEMAEEHAKLDVEIPEDLERDEYGNPVDPFPDADD